MQMQSKMEFLSLNSIKAREMNLEFFSLTIAHQEVISLFFSLSLINFNHRFEHSEVKD